MKEHDYLQVSNYVKVNMACQILRDCLFPTVSDAKRSGELLEKMEQYRDSIRPVIK